MQSIRIRRSRVVSAVAGAIGVFVGMSACTAGYADPAPPTAQDLQTDIILLKEQLSILAQQQKQILDQVNSLKDMITKNPQIANTNPPTPSANPQQPAPPAMPSTINVAGLPMEGNANAHVAMIEFTDFECPFCRRFAAQTYPQILSDYIKAGKIRLYYHDYPLGFHAHAMPNAEAANCAEEQGNDKFWAMHDAQFSDPLAASDDDEMTKAKSVGLDMDKFSACYSSHKYQAIIKNRIGEVNTVSATPTFYIGIVSADGSVVKVDHQVLGAVPYNQFQTALDADLAQKTAHS